ncbi:hypothetical protein L0156_07880 [bacterium]|nr:hypothetical protein [bacterium]
MAAFGNAVVTLLNRDAELKLEIIKAESTRILEMIKTGDTEKAAKNLEFLIKTGLITDEERVKRLAEFLKNRPPGTGPSLPGPSPKFGFEPSEFLPE